MKQLVLFLLHFFWLCYTMKEKQMHSKKADTPRPHICKVAVELLRSPDSILYPFKHKCSYIYMKFLASERTKPCPDSTLGGIFKPRFLARSTGECLLDFALYPTKLKVFNLESWKFPSACMRSVDLISFCYCQCLRGAGNPQSVRGQTCWE